MGADEQQLLDNFFAGIARDSITAFIRAVVEQPQLMEGLQGIDLVADDVAAFAQTKGFAFSANDLEAFLEDRMKKELGAAELDLRRAFQDRSDRGKIPAPVSMNKTAAIKEHALDFTSESDKNLSLDRAEILKGGVAIIRQAPAIARLTSVLREILEEHFKPHNPLVAHEKLSAAPYKARVDAAYEALLAEKRIPPILTAFMEEIGVPPNQTVFEWPGFRLTFPHGSQPQGYYRTTCSGSLPPHRDTWYGSPRQQINLWGPIYPLETNETLRVLSAYYYRSIKNSSRGYDVWRNAVGLNLSPMLREHVDASNPIAPPLAMGDVMAFAAHHLHHSALNQRKTTRVTFEFRLLCKEDKGANYVPPNIDYFGFGEIYKGWFQSDGEKVFHKP